MTPEVEKAVEEIKTLFSDHKIEVEAVSDGGARVIVDDIEIGAQYSPSKTWMGFIIGFQYPRADVYPHYISSEVKRNDGQERKDGHPLGEGFSGPLLWQERNCTQISRRSNKLDPTIDTAVTKLVKVIEWVKLR